MGEKRVVRIFENLNYFSEAFSSIPITTLNEVGKTAATLICSILTYQVAAVLFIGDEDGEPQLLASKGVNEGSISAWNSREALIKHLLRDISISTIFKCETLNESIAGSARRLGLGDMFLAVPLKSREHGREQIGFVIAAQPRRNFEPDVDMMGLEIIAGIVAGALKNCINRTTLLETNRRIQNESMRRKRTEEALRESDKQYRETLDAMGDWILVVDPDLRIVLFNAAFMQINKQLGLTTDVIGRTPMEIFPFLPDTLLDEYRWVFENKRVLITQENTKVGSREFITESRKIPLLKKGRIVRVISVIRDITEQKRLEAQLQQSQKMEAIGTLAGGLAHDFNNLLMGIQGNVSLVLMDMDSTHSYYGRLKTIEKQVFSGARLTSHLLGYARKGKYEVRAVDLNQLVEETCETFGRIRKQITIHREVADGLFAIEADSGQIEQVLWNLFINAADAMPGGGDLILKTMNTTHDDMKGKVYEPKPGKYVLLTVTDTGMGMDKETMKRVFDPFFTTKETGLGTGLGLASSYGIIKGHGGYIDVESEKGYGATFSIYLPASEKEVRKVVKTAEKIDEGTGTALLVDDEEVILEVGKDLLEAIGYRVLIARDGKEAIEVYEKNRDDIDIVVLDMVMPNMGGSGAFDRIKEINPDAKILLSSGYSIDGEATEILERGCNAFIQKPFTMKVLSQAIRKTLGKK